MSLPIDFESLINHTSVESDRVEFKEGWNPNAIYRSICAFANDFDNLGGGYIIVGIEEKDGIAQRPVKGLPLEQLDKIQREMIGFNQLIRPEYYPRLFIEDVDQKKLLVIWIPGSSNRPHQVPEVITDKQKTFHYYIRKYANSVKASLPEQQELISLANQVPFDDRPNTQASLEDISLFWIREYLQQTNSRLLDNLEQTAKRDLLQQMALLSGPLEQEFPRNVSLMLFSERPDRFFPYTYIEVVRYTQGPADRDFTETRFTGPVHHQIRQLTDYLISQVLLEKVIKLESQAESIRVFNYPLIALQEAIANCIFHRDYQVREPIKVFIHPDKIILFNSGGPDRSVKLDDLRLGHPRPKRYRNRRLGDFLKALRLTEGHATGIALIMKTLKQNGSPVAEFDIDDERTYFEVTFPIHPEFVKGEERPFFNFRTPKTSRFLKYLSEQVLAFEEAPLSKEQIKTYQSIIENLEPSSLAIISAMANNPPMKRKEVLERIGLSNQTKNAERYLEPLILLKVVSPVIKTRPNSPLQRYMLTERGQNMARWLAEENQK
ncbi:RNA-binding domain-containing protein [Siphonobacter sp. SORGH_AS_0500]|uniref:RNA-binding domain-containing protein n=1 Tax=Siphonobacter sp. SORGH_AS_0500 TaxID=1864824 RepID=UPI00286648D5|nr:RNA-binding domain-containing protein [Siphonobacter sp. SORGH_AS_0500]MDR6198080.1 ATP-dependent DNA helicase RecG [Siphonobacter sp. SORGH_AS_0500]